MTIGECDVEGCDRVEQLRRDWCGMHYKRWQKTGDVGIAGGLRPGTTGECAAEDCDKPIRTSGDLHCEMHYYRLRRNGTLDANPWHKRGLCSIEECDQPEDALGLCSKHAARKQRHGDPHKVIHQRDRDLPRGAAHSRWSGDDATYTGVHQRLKGAKGRAADHRCTDCGNAAKHWSYDHADPSERVCELGAYSTDLDHYVPRCVPCHKTFDLALLGGAA